MNHHQKLKDGLTQMVNTMTLWCISIHRYTTGFCATNRVFLISLLATILFFYPALRGNSIDAGFLYTGDVLGLFWPAIAKTHSLLSTWNFTALDFSTYNGSSDYFLAPNFFVLHPLVVAYSFVFSPTSTTLQDLGHFLVMVIAFHCFLASYFSLKCLTRFFSFDFGSAAFVAIAFAFSVNMIGSIGEPMFIFCISVLPWSVYGVLAYAQSPTITGLLTASMPILFAFLGGYVPLGVTSVAMSLVLVFIRLIAMDDGAGTPLDYRLRRMVVALMPFILASLVVIPYFYAVYRFLGESISAHAPSLFFSAHQLAQYPQSFLRLLSSRLSLPGPFYEMSFSAGFIATTIAALFVFSKAAIKAVTSREWVLIKVSLFIYIFVALSTFGNFSAVSDMVYYFIPQIGNMHIYQRFLLPAHLFLALMIAIMLRALLDVGPTTATRVAVAFYAIATIFVAYVVARNPSLAQEVGINGYVLFELLLCFLFLVVLYVPDKAFVYGVTIFLASLPALDTIYDYSHGAYTNSAQRNVLPMALDDEQKARFVNYVKRFGEKQVIKYVDLTPLWNKDTREPFPKSFPYHVLKELRLSSYHGFDFRMGARAEYLKRMPIVVKDGTWVLSPNWDVIASAGADFLIAYETDLKSGFLGAIVSKAKPEDLYRLPNGIVAVPLRPWSQEHTGVTSEAIDNGYFKISAADTHSKKLINVARGAHATQSSTYEGREARLAVDGVTNGNPDAWSISHTEKNVNAWLDIDLGATATIDSIGIWNQTGCCGFRLRDYWVFVSEIPFKSSDTASVLRERQSTWGRANPTPNPHALIRVGGIKGRYVRIQLGGSQPPDEAYLHLAEVEVFASDSTSPAQSLADKTKGKVKLVDFKGNDANYMRLEWESPDPTTIQYLFSDNPRLRYFLNGEAAKVTERNGLVTIDAPRGLNVLELKYQNRPLLIFWIIFGAYGIACLIALASFVVRKISERNGHSSNMATPDRTV